MRSTMTNKAPFPLMIICAVLLLGSVDGFGQLRVSLNISSRPDPYLSNWSQRKEIVIVTVTNSSANPIDAKFDCKVNKDGALLANTKRESMQVLSLQPGVTQFYGEDLVPLAAMKIIGDAEKTAVKTGMLPAGSYEFCVGLIEPSSFKELTTPVCKNFTVESAQAPILLLPLDGDSMRAGQRPLFRWSIVKNNTSTTVRFHLQVFEVMAGQTPITAFRVNRPIIDIPDIQATQQLWPPDIDLVSQQKSLVWTVRATDDNGNPVGEPNGYATPFVLKTSQPANARREADVGVGVGVAKAGEGDVANRSSNSSSSSSRSASGPVVAAVPVAAVVESERSSVERRSAYVAPPSLPWWATRSQLAGS
ncbi:MAG: hypothetical protein NTX15_00350 [Candidatus Kapabacteria bacterium]|nr:hypothetical protein [Candidatus Kapabacteria bacterium]